MSRRRFAVLLGVIALAGLGIRLGFVATNGDVATNIGDSYFYYHVARQLVDGDGYIRPVEFADLGTRIETAEHPPLFPFVLAIPQALGLRSITEAEVFCCFIATGTVALIGLLGRRVGGSAVGLVAAALAAGYPILWQPPGLLLSETLYVPLVVVILLLAYAIIDRPSILRWCALGAAIGAAALTRGEGFAFMIVLGIPLLWRSARGFRALLKPTAALVLSAVVVVTPWTIRNAMTFEHFIPISNNLSIALSGANCHKTYHGSQIGAFNVRCFFDAAFAARHRDELTEEEHMYEKIGRQGRAYMFDHLDRLPVVVTARVLRTWGLWPPGPLLDYDYVDYGLREPLAVGYGMFLGMFVLAIGGVVVLRRRRTKVWPLLVPALVVVAVSAALHGLTRFRAAMEPSVIVLAAVAIVAIGARIRAQIRARHAEVDAAPEAALVTPAPVASPPAPATPAGRPQES